MKTRRAFVLALTSGLVALGLIVTPVIADELIGMIVKVDADNSKLTVVEKGSDKEVEITTNGDTELVTPKGASKVDLAKLAKNLEKAKEKGRKGVSVTITHEKSVASKITIAAKKKGARKKDN